MKKRHKGRGRKMTGKALKMLLPYILFTAVLAVLSMTACRCAVKQLQAVNIDNPAVVQIEQQGNGSTDMAV